MNEVLKAMATSAAILLPIVVLIVTVSVAVVKRGEIATGGGDHAVLHESHPIAVASAATAAAVAAAAAPAAPAVKKPAAASAAEEVSVITILVLGIVMFTAVMGLLLVVSIAQHAG